MSFLITKPLFPIVSVSLGKSVAVTSGGKDVKGKETKITTETFYYGVFSIHTPNRMYLLTSETGDNVNIPKLNELVNHNCLSLDGFTFDHNLPKVVLTALHQWFSAPLNEIDGISPYSLASWGMINQTLFTDTIKRVLNPVLSASNLTLESIDTDKVVRAIHLTRATALGVNSDHTSLGDKIQSYLNTLKANKQLTSVDDKPSVIIDVKKSEVKDDVTPSSATDDNTKLPDESVPLKSFTEGTKLATAKA